ncbi:MAG: hypothetical protein ABW007_08525 [Chitinophagaceae bacterium]
MPDIAKTFMIEDARILFRNFAGREDKYNREGDRNFAVVLPEDVAEQMLQDGWNVRFLEPREEGDEPTAYISVAVNFNNRPPRVVLLTSTTRTQLDERTIEVLDWADIQTADLIARGYDWTVNGKSGTKAYLQSLFVTIEEDALERKYAVHEISEN